MGTIDLSVIKKRKNSVEKAYIAPLSTRNHHSIETRDHDLKNEKIEEFSKLKLAALAFKEQKLEKLR